MDERTNDRDRWRDPRNHRDAYRTGDDERWHAGARQGGSGGYGRYDDRSEADRNRGRAVDPRERRDGGDRELFDEERHRYEQYAREGFEGAYRRDRDDSRRIVERDPSGYDRRGEEWRRDAARHREPSRDGNWGAAFNAGDYREVPGGRGYGADRWESEREERRHGRPSDRDDARGERGRGDRRRSDDHGGYDERGRNDDRHRFDDRGRNDDRFRHDDRGRYDDRGRFDDRGRYDDRGRHDDRRGYGGPGAGDDASSFTRHRSGYGGRQRDDDRRGRDEGHRYFERSGDWRREPRGR